MTFKKRLLSLIFLIFAFVLMANAVALVTYAAAKLYLYVVRDIPFGTYLPSFMRLVKGATVGGLVAGGGCWFAYLKNERS